MHQKQNKISSSPQANSPQSATTQKPQKNMNFVLLAGHLTECFNNTLYGFFAVMLAPVFFSNSVQLASYGAFAAGFFARPLGAILFGMMGDKYGRKRPLIYSITFIGIPTILIGLTPSFSQIGLWSPIILILCRTLQGFFNGGEFAGINLLIAEDENKQQLGAKAGLLISAGVFGSVLASSVGAITALDFFPTWGWRIPFIVGGVMSLLFLPFTKGLQETTEFRTFQASEKKASSPWKTLIKTHKFSLFCAILLSGYTLIPLYLATVFGNQIFKDLGFTHSESMGLNGIALTVDGLTLVLFGKLADKIGFQTQIKTALILATLLALPTFYIISVDQSTLAHAFLFIIPLVLLGGMATSCTFLYISNLFPVNCRYSALAISVTTGQALFGGTTPMIASYLIGQSGIQIAPAFWLILISTLALVTLSLREKFVPVQPSTILPKHKQAITKSKKAA